MAICAAASPNAAPLALPTAPGLARRGELTDDEGLPGAGRPDQRLDHRAGGEDAANGGGWSAPSSMPWVASWSR